MCLAIPMQIDAIDGFLAQCSVKGVSRTVNLFLLQERPPVVGDQVLVHLGYAIQVLDPNEARRHWETLDAVLAVMEDDAHA